MRSIVFLLLLPATIQAKPCVPVEVVDAVEVNHLYGEDGEKRFSQVVYWNRDGTTCAHVRHWHMAEALRSVERDGATYIVTRQKDGIYRTVRAKRFIVTRTLVDPEERDRADWPIEIRLGLY